MGVVVGVDPDSAAHGIAIYVDGVLAELKMLTLMEIIELLESHDRSELLFSIEDVRVNKFIYKRNEKRSKAAQSHVGISVGKCQQACEELIRALDYYKIKYKLHKPQKGNWSKSANTFKLYTKWKGRSNEDTRSAAYFGFLAL